MRAVARQFIAASGMTRALLHFVSHKCSTLCTACLILAAHVLRLSDVRRPILEFAAQPPFDVAQDDAYHCNQFLLQGLTQLCRDDWYAQQVASEVKRSTTQFKFLIRKRDGSIDFASECYKTAADEGKKAQGLLEEARLLAATRPKTPAADASIASPSPGPGNHKTAYLLIY